MSNDKIKEILNTLRVLLTIVSAIAIASGGSIGGIYKSGLIGYLFFALAGVFMVSVIIAVVLLWQIKNYLKKME